MFHLIPSFGNFENGRRMDLILMESRSRLPNKNLEFQSNLHFGAHETTISPTLNLALR